MRSHEHNAGLKKRNLLWETCNFSTHESTCTQTPLHFERATNSAIMKHGISGLMLWRAGGVCVTFEGDRIKIQYRESL